MHLKFLPGWALYLNRVSNFEIGSVTELLAGCESIRERKHFTPLNERSLVADAELLQDGLIAFGAGVP
jgi:hypothetical protein